MNTKELTTLLKEKIEENGYVDAGESVAKAIGVPVTTFRVARAELREEGYHFYQLPFNVPSKNKTVVVKVLTNAGVSKDEARTAYLKSGYKCANPECPDAGNCHGECAKNF